MSRNQPLVVKAQNLVARLSLKTVILCWQRSTLLTQMVPGATPQLKIWRKAITASPLKFRIQRVTPAFLLSQWHLTLIPLLRHRLICQALTAACLTTYLSMLVNWSTTIRPTMLNQRSVVRLKLVPLSRSMTTVHNWVLYK
ncbi:hypothetical protein D3C79_912890 [compost metagenome]